MQSAILCLSPIVQKKHEKCVDTAGFGTVDITGCIYLFCRELWNTTIAKTLCLSHTVSCKATLCHLDVNQTDEGSKIRTINRRWHISTTPNTTKKKNVQVQTNTVVFYGHPELSGEEKSKFEFEEKKFSIVVKMEICWVFKPQTSIFSTILNFFSSNSNFDFSSPDNSVWP